MRKLRGVAVAIIFCVAFSGVSSSAQQRYEDQPNMDAALQGLKQAQTALERATSDKGGHRLVALDFVKKAINEVQAGITYAEQHHGEIPGGNWRGKLSADDQRRFDSYYSRWLEYKRSSNWDEIGSMEERMRDIMEHYRIPAEVPFDQIATNAKAAPANQWRSRLSDEDQKRFDSYYSRWLEYKRTNNPDEVTSMENRMRDVMSHYGIPPNTPFVQIATPR